MRGTGAYTLDVDVLPQVVSVKAEALLPGAGAAPGGPTTSLVITLQGDRLDPDEAENPANYTVIWLGPDGDQAIPVAPGQSAVYDPSSNVDVATGVTYPTAIRQTVTLLFNEPLPPGAYQIELAPAIQAASFSDDESASLSTSGFTGHPVASLVNGAISAGDIQTVPDLVSASLPLGDLAVWQTGTPFLTQLHDDLGALLEAQLTALGDAPTISPAINSQIVARFNPALGAPDKRPIAVLVIWVDPVPVDLYGGKNQVSFNPQTNSYVSTFSTGFVSVAGNVELVVLPFTPNGVQNYVLGVSPTPAARGGVDYFGAAGDQVQSLTVALRGGETQFLLSFGGPAPVESPQPPSPAVDVSAANSALATARLVNLSGTPSGNILVTSITPLATPSQTAAPGRRPPHSRDIGGRRGDCVPGRRRSGEPGGAARPAIDREPNRGASRRRPARGCGRARPGPDGSTGGGGRAAAPAAARASGVVAEPAGRFGSGRRGRGRAGTAQAQPWGRSPGRRLKSQRTGARGAAWHSRGGGRPARAGANRPGGAVGSARRFLAHGRCANVSVAFRSAKGRAFAERKPTFPGRNHHAR